MGVQPRDLIIVGAGPAGLATAIAAKAHGLSSIVFDQGGLVDSIFRFPSQMVFFTTPELLEIGGLPFVTPYEKPTRHEALKYYRRVADSFHLSLALDHCVTGIVSGPERVDLPSTLTVSTRSGSGEQRDHRARAVVLATGYYNHPNLLGVPGEDLPHVSHYYTEAHAYYRRDVVVVGGQNSAAEAALELHRAGARVTLVHRGATLGPSIKYWVKPDIENRIAESAIGVRFSSRVREIQPSLVVIDREGMTEQLRADRVLLLTGYHPDFELLESAGVHVDPVRRVVQFDPDTLETNVPNLFLAGGVISSRDTSPIFIENGRYHGERIVRLLTARWAPFEPQPAA
jgi:thioredoxin reductase (NADPH)